MAAQSRTDHEALLCDTNVLVRLLSGEPQSQADSASRALDGGVPIVLTDLVVAEVAYVLIARAGMTPADAADQIGRVLDLESVIVVSRPLLTETLEIWSAGRVGFADAYLAALNRQTLNTAVLSFDRDFDRIEGVERVDPKRY